MNYFINWNEKIYLNKDGTSLFTKNGKSTDIKIVDVLNFFERVKVAAKSTILALSLCFANCICTWNTPKVPRAQSSSR
jgi:hypothetical protein